MNLEELRRKSIPLAGPTRERMVQAIRERLWEAFDCQPGTDTITLRWEPLRDHSIWTIVANDLTEAMETMYRQGFMEGCESVRRSPQPTFFYPEKGLKP